MNLNNYIGSAKTSYCLDDWVTPTRDLMIRTYVSPNKTCFICYYDGIDTYLFENNQIVE